MLLLSDVITTGSASKPRQQQTTQNHIGHKWLTNRDVSFWKIALIGLLLVRYHWADHQYKTTMHSASICLSVSDLSFGEGEGERDGQTPLLQIDLLTHLLSI